MQGRRQCRALARTRRVEPVHLVDVNTAEPEAAVILAVLGSQVDVTPAGSVDMLVSIDSKLVYGRPA